MTRWIVRGLLLVLVIAGGVWAWRAVFPSPEKVIRKRLVEVAKLASFNANEAPLAKLSNTQQLLAHFASTVEISIEVPGRSMQTVTGTEELRQALMGARAQLSAMTVEFLDIGVRLGADAASAVASTTVRARISGESDPIVQEMKFSFSRTEGDWLIKRIETVNTLR
jgi:hypothetical protein